MKHILIFSILILLALMDIQAQDIIIDRPVKAGELTLFQSLRNQNEYFYLPDKPRLGTDEQGRPQFSFLRYVENVGSGSGEEDIVEGEGGGIVHAVIELGVTEEQRSRASRELRRVNSSGQIIGPVVYQGGTIALISSVNDPESGFSRKVLGLGTAPVLDGHKAAVSVQLTKLGAKVLWESFQTPTPDFSISFEMDLEGYESPKSVLIEANFDQIYRHQSFEAGLISRQEETMLAGEIEQAYDDLYRSGAIKVTQIGEDEDLQKALDDAYGKLTRMMFEQAEGNPMAIGQTNIPGQQSRSILDRAQSILEEGRKDAQEDFEFMQEALNYERELFGEPGSITESVTESSSDDDSQDQTNETRPHPRPENPPAAYTDPPSHHVIPPRDRSYERPTLPTTAVVAAYRMRESRQRGVFRIDLNKYSLSNLTVRFDENLGNVSACEECFHQVNLDDPFFRQREIAAVLGGFNAQDFGSYINFVSVILKKEHQNGDFTFEDVRIDRTKFNETANNTKMVYGWKGDDDRQEWREYEYRIVWNFFGGYTKESDWIKSTGNSIPLIPPLRKKSVDVEIFEDTMKDEGVRSVEVKLYYDLGETDHMEQVRMNVRAGEFAKRIDLLQPANSLNYEYEVSWFLNDGTTKTSGRIASNSTIIYADTL